MLARAAGAVVADLNKQAVAGPADPHCRAAGPAVLGDIGQRLGDREVGDRLDRRRHRAEVADVEVGRDAAARGHRAQGAGETLVGQDRRIHRPDHLAQLGHRLLGALVRLPQQVGDSRWRVGQRLPGDGQPHRDRHQPGLGAVVQVALDPAQLGAVRVEHIRAGAGQLGHPVGEPLGRGRGQPGQRDARVQGGQRWEQDCRDRREDRELRGAEDHRARPAGHRHLDQQARRVGRREQPPQRHHDGGEQRIAEAVEREQAGRHADGRVHREPRQVAIEPRGRWWRRAAAQGRRPAQVQHCPAPPRHREPQQRERKHGRHCCGQDAQQIHRRRPRSPHP
ncbi:hypothetical protein Pflav_039740 [Phytohabitans flavus]|uniref:Uncharacterized protein n=1 Tax=Phytohabitans flavus TaxID=1076124 RepID=A0A6F8XUP5_9ACTN|nr:hypothetical protein Pflav_039740 [Phytohabitans flavus]